MATTKNRWQDVIGPMRDYLRVGFSGPRLKNASGVLQIRNAGDSADANLKASLLQLSGGSPGAGKVLTSDASGNGSWSTAVSIYGNALQSHLFLVPIMFNQVTPDIFFDQYNTSQFMNMYGYLSGLNSEITAQLALAAGTYRVDLISIKNNSGGQCALKLDGATLATFNGYNATQVFNAPFSVTGVSVSEGLHSLNLQVTGKNASSTGYAFAFTYITVRRTA